MEGFIVNKTGLAQHRFKRNLMPGEGIPLSELYEMYVSMFERRGNSVPFSDGESFIEWLRKVKKVPENQWPVLPYLNGVTSSGEFILPNRRSRLERIRSGTDKKGDRVVEFDFSEVEEGKNQDSGRVRTAKPGTVMLTEQVVTSDKPIKLSSVAGALEAADAEFNSEIRARVANWEKLSFRDIANLKLKDGPKEILAHIGSVSKLRRALRLAREQGKQKLTRLIKSRLDELEAIPGAK